MSCTNKNNISDGRLVIAGSDVIDCGQMGQNRELKLARVLTACQLWSV